MILKYGTYAHDQNEANVIITRRPLRTQGEQRNGYTESWRISGKLHAASQAALTTALASLKSAYGTDGLNLAFYLDDGTTLTDHYLLSSATTGGTRVVQGVDFPSSDGAEYSTFRTYEVVVEGDVQTTAGGNGSQLESWVETLSFQGTGGPLFRFLPTINGPWQRQQTSDSSTCFITQRGQAVGTFAYPTPRAPILPGAEHVEQRVIEYQSAQREGAGLKNFPVSWSYFFETGEPSGGQVGQWP